MSDPLPFRNGVFLGKGHWIDQKADGDDTAQYTIDDGASSSKVHTVHRVFLKPDGSPLYEENSTVTFTPTTRNKFTITITTAKGSVSGSGYCFGDQCHYEVDISPENHMEFTFTVGEREIHGLASSTNKGNFTSWRETLTPVG